MHVIVKGKNIDLPEQTVEYAEKKLSKLETFFTEAEVKKIEVVISKESFKVKDLQWKVQATVFLLGKTVLRAEEKHQTAQAAIDETIDKLEKQIERYKTKLHTKVRRTSKIDPEIKEVTSSYEDYAYFETNLANEVIEKRKEFPVESMFPDEAVERMLLLHHNFFVFTNKETSKLAIVYEREAGSYGLLEPTQV